jgi:hypothetical protein
MIGFFKKKGKREKLGAERLTESTEHPTKGIEAS